MPIELVRASLRSPRVRSSLIRILRENVLASFATVGRGSTAYINTAYFAPGDDWSLYFYSYPDSTHCRNLERSHSMAVAVFDSRQRWGGEDRGVQFFGSCRQATGKWAAVAERVYAGRFPSFHRWREKLLDEGRGFALRPYRFAPHRAKIFDERTLGGGRFFEVETR